MSNKNVIAVKEGIDFREIGGLCKRLIHPQTVGSKNLGMSIVFLNPGEEIISHRHPMEEAYFVIQGVGVTSVEGFGQAEMHKFTCIYIPANALHSTRNIGNEPLVFVAALSPPAPPV